MNEQQTDELIKVLNRIANSLENINIGLHHIEGDITVKDDPRKL
jgi:hypothetical protein